MLDERTKKEIAFAVLWRAVLGREWSYRYTAEYFGVSHWTVWKVLVDSNLIALKRRALSREDLDNLKSEELIISFMPGRAHQLELVRRRSAALGKAVEPWFLPASTVQRPRGSSVTETEKDEKDIAAEYGEAPRKEDK
jgi:hypothetical protein